MEPAVQTDRKSTKFAINHVILKFGAIGPSELNSLRTSEQRERAIGMVKRGTMHAHVARTFVCSRVAVGNLFQGFRQTGRTSDMVSKGRPRVTTPKEDRYLRTLHLRNRFLTVTPWAVNALDRWVSTHTVTKRFRAAGMGPIDRSEDRC